MSIITPVEAHKLIRFEANEVRSRAGADASTLLLPPTGALADVILAQPAVPAVLRCVLSKDSDSANAIALAAAAIATILAVTTSSAGYISGLGFFVCALLVNVVAPFQVREAGRKQQTILGRYFVALCEGVVIAAEIAWARTPFPIGLVLLLAWVALQEGVLGAANQQQQQKSRFYRARALDLTCLVYGVALGSGSDASSLGPMTFMFGAAAASLTASIALANIVRAAGINTEGGSGGAGAAGPRSTSVPAALASAIDVVRAFVDVDLVLNASGFARFVLLVTASTAVFAGASSSNSAYSTLALVAFAFVALAEVFRATEIARALDTPFFSNVVTAYVDGVFDLCHIGHKNLVNFAAKHANRVVCGVMADEDCITYKRAPVMTTSERCIEVAALKHVSRVIPGAPCFGLTEEFLRQEGIDLVVLGQEYFEKPVEDDKYYHVPRRLGMAIAAPRTGGVSTSQLIKRILERGEEGAVAKDKVSGGSTVKV
jgi:cytidyltransferase-like protein